uniref:Uncharacterized protein n=1 Tax=Vespula pensylvanica TaxID=30213 RepID=A0A834JS88_VESPE|nr:hypothetical protein H0235_017486 [Vespula pensylvanica]
MKGGECALCRWTEAEDEIRQNPRNHEIANQNEIFQDEDLVFKECTEMDSLRDLVEILEVRQKQPRHSSEVKLKDALEWIAYFHGYCIPILQFCQCERAQNILSWIMKSPLVGLTIGLVNK